MTNYVKSSYVYFIDIAEHKAHLLCMVHIKVLLRRMTISNRGFYVYSH